MSAPNSTTKTNPLISTPESPITVTLHALQANTIPLPTLTSAFGPSSLGILLVRSLPPRYTQLRSRVLSHSSRLAHLSAEKLERLTNERAKYLVGWSHGKESLRPGVVDTGKGSYYVNCDFYPKERRKRDEAIEERGEGEDDDCGHDHVKEEGEGKDDEAKRWEGFAEYTAPNIWPDEDDIPGFRAEVEELITLIIDVAVLVARACDTYALEAVEGYQRGYLERVVKTSRTTKARLLHYFPAGGKEGGEEEGTNGEGAGLGRNVNVHGADGDNSKDTGTNEEDDWCATHLDHGCLTGLTSAMFVDESTPIPTTGTSSTSNPSDPLPELPTSPNPAAGLYILSRNNATTKISIPRDCLAFQTGEALELITQGKFKAVPHFVRGVPAAVRGGPPPADGTGGGGRRIARNTLAVFTQPGLGEWVDRQKGVRFGEFARGVVGRNTA